MDTTASNREEVMVSSNGIPLYYYGNQKNHSFCICLYIKAGSMYEPDGWNGATHLWEHAIFRKMNRLFQGNFYRQLDLWGLTFSACTYKEFVAIRIEGATFRFRDAASIISRVFEPMNISRTELEIEKKRIKAEIRESAELTSLDYFTQQIVWQSTALRNTITGSCRTLDKIGVKSLSAIQDGILSAGNLFFYVTGCFDREDVAALSDFIGRYSLNNALPVRENVAPVPASFFRRRGQVAVKNSDYHCVRFSFDIEVNRYTQSELDLLYDILFSGDMSRIYQELSEKTGYIYGFDARLERYCNIGCLYFSFEIQRKHILGAVASVVEILNGLKRNIGEGLALVLPPYVQNAEMVLDRAEDLNWDMAYECHIMNGKHRSIAERRAIYEAVTPERLMTVSRELFVANHAVLTIKTNAKTFPESAAVKLLQQLG